MKVVIGGHVRHTVVKHDLCAAELKIGGIYFASK